MRVTDVDWNRRGAARRSMLVADVGRVIEVQLDVRCG